MVPQLTKIIAIPDSAVYDCSDIRSKTDKIFQIARIVAIFEFSDIIIYHDPHLKPREAHRERRIINRILKYVECPQYLRKRLFPLSRDFVAVGTLSPLALPHHSLSKAIKVNEYREAAIFLNQGRVRADVGYSHLLEVESVPNISFVNRTMRVTVKIQEKDTTFFAKVVPKPPKNVYWGYKVHSSAATLTKLLKDRPEYKIATSRTCQPISEISISPSRYNNLLVAFGGPYHGIPEILKADGKKINEIFDICISILKHYGTRALRLEEALSITLSRLQDVIK